MSYEHYDTEEDYDSEENEDSDHDLANNDGEAENVFEVLEEDSGTKSAATELLEHWVLKLGQVRKLGRGQVNLKERTRRTKTLPSAEELEEWVVREEALRKAARLERKISSLKERMSVLRRFPGVLELNMDEEWLPRKMLPCLMQYLSDPLSRVEKMVLQYEAPKSNGGAAVAPLLQCCAHLRKLSLHFSSYNSPVAPWLLAGACAGTLRKLTLEYGTHEELQPSVLREWLAQLRRCAQLADLRLDHLSHS